MKDTRTVYGQFSQVFSCAFRTKIPTLSVWAEGEPEREKRGSKMISRRQFFTITILMITVLFLCMCINNLKDNWNDYAVNRYTETGENYPSQIHIYVPENAGEEDEGDEGTEKKETLIARNKVICVAEAGGMLEEIAEQWVTYTKRDIASYSTLRAFGKAWKRQEKPEMLVLDSGCVDWESREDLALLTECLEGGTHLVFGNLPEASVLEKNPGARELLGIRTVLEEETSVIGFHLREGFLLGGETFYLEKAARDAEEPLPGSASFPGEETFPWYLPASGTKVYMRGIAEGEGVKAENYPIMIWRRSFGGAYVFAVNGGLMQGLSGMGLLSAMSAEMYSYELYPVVNAQNMILAAYPSLADENREEMERRYSRSVKQVFQELMWPNIAAVLERHNYRATCMMTPQYDYEDQNLPDGRQLKFYLKIFNEKAAETGLWGFNVSNTPPAQKLAEDAAFLKEELSGYAFASFYAGDMSEEEIEAALEEEALASVKTVVRDTEGTETAPVAFLTEEVTAQRVLENGLEYTYEKDFLVRSMETALGYFSAAFDLSRVAYPDGDGDGWGQLSRGLATTVGIYGQTFQGFARTTAAECDAHIRQFLALDYRDSRTEDEVHLQVEGLVGPAWFILRTHNESIKDMEGGSWQKLEEGAYLIEVQEEEVILTLDSTDRRFYR